MTLPPSLVRLLAIHSEDDLVIQKGRLVQRIILAVSLVSLLSGVTNLIRVNAADAATYQLITALGEISFTPLVAFISLFQVRRGQPIRAAHFFFIAINTIFFVQFAARETLTTLPYFMLISVIGIATVDSVRSSILYTAVIISSMFGYFLLAANANFALADLIAFVFAAISIGTVAWISANAMQNSLAASVQLMAAQKAQTQLVQRRAQQLQRGAAVSQSASLSLNLDDLLQDAVYTIRDQFGFYFVAVYLLDESEQYLTLREATGAVGQEMKKRRYQIDVASKSIVGWVVQHREAHIAHDVFEDPVFFNEPLLRDTRSELALPLQAHGRILGVLDVQSQQPAAFVEEDRAILQIMANQVAANIANATLFARTQQHLVETQTLLNLSSSLATTMDVGEIYRRAARTFANQLAAAKCTMTTWHEPTQSLVTQITYVRRENGRLVEQFDLNTTVYPLADQPDLLQALADGQPIHRSLSNSRLTAEQQNLLQTAGFHHSLEIPLLAGPQTKGLIIIGRDAHERPFDETEIQLAQVMANQTAIALNNASLTSEARGRVAQLSALNRLSQTLSLAPTLHDIFDGVRREIFSLFEATAMSVILKTPDGEHLDWIFAYEYGEEVDLSEIGPMDINQGFSGQVARTRHYLLINDRFPELAEKYQSITVGAMSSTWLGFPLIVANELIGVLAIENENNSDAFGERDVELLETIAGAVAIALNNHLQFEAVQQALLVQSIQRNQLQTAAEVSAVTTSILELDELLERAVNLIRDRFALYYAGLFLIDQGGLYAVLRAATGEAGRIQLQQGHRLAVGGQSLIGGATGDGQPRITQDVSVDREWQANPHLPATRSELALPLRVRGQIIGALTVQSTEPGNFGPELVSILQAMTDQLAVAIDNARLLAAAQSRVRRQQELNRISAELHGAADIDHILHIGLKAISDRMAGQPVALTLGTQKEATRPSADNGRHPAEAEEQP